MSTECSTILPSLLSIAGDGSGLRDRARLYEVPRDCNDWVLTLAKGPAKSTPCAPAEGCFNQQHAHPEQSESGHPSQNLENNSWLHAASGTRISS